MKLRTTVFLLASCTQLVRSQFCSYVFEDDGLCVTESVCNDYGGWWVAGYCPDNGPSIRCCTDIPCDTDYLCESKYGCGGTLVPGYCPGPAGFECCE